MGKEYIVVGLMSGTSLDGVDVAVCSFIRNNEQWGYKLLFSKTFNYNREWQTLLEKAHTLSGQDLIKLDHQYGNYLGSLVKSVLHGSKIKPDFIASHGHTVFHEPAKGFTLQIGSGAQISAVTNLPVVCDFRSLDVAKGGQGAPLVPVGDKLLFPQFDACLNLGGFSNISFELNNKRTAFDICPVNIALNAFAQKLGKTYDEDGMLARKGEKKEKLVADLNRLKYYSTAPPKSLSREWLEKSMMPILDESKIDDLSKLTSLYYHIADQISETLNNFNLKNVLLTGGGTFNEFLIELIISKAKPELIIPEKSLIDYKEAIIFAFLGLLRNLGVVNCFASVTGANEDSICGTIYG